MPHSVPVSKLMRPPREWPMLRGDSEVQLAIKVLRIITEEKKLGHGHSTPLVYDDSGSLLGFVHLTDLLRNVRHLCERSDTPCELGAATTPIREIATRFAAHVEPDDSILKALDIMMDHGVSLVPVILDGKLLGIVQLADIFGMVAALLFDEENPDERRKLVRRFAL